MANVNVVAEIEIDVEIEQPFDSDVAAQAVQDAIGHTGAKVLEVLIADGASDLA